MFLKQILKNLHYIKRFYIFKGCAIIYLFLILDFLCVCIFYVFWDINGFLYVKIYRIVNCLVFGIKIKNGYHLKKRMRRTKSKEQIRKCIHRNRVLYSESWYIWLKVCQIHLPTLELWFKS